MHKIIVIRLYFPLDATTRPDVSSSTRITARTKVCEYSLYKTLLMMDRWGPKHVELT